jgi:hypothetical protein
VGTGKLAVNKEVALRPGDGAASRKWVMEHEKPAEMAP